MFLNLPTFKGEKELAYQKEQFRRIAFLQRWLVLGGGAIYGLAGLWVSFYIGESGAGFATTALALLFGTLALWGLTYAPYLRNRLEIVPILVALGFGTAIVMSLVIVPAAGELRFAVLFGSLVFYTVLMAPTIQSSFAALTAAALIATLGLVVVFPIQDTPIDFFGALAYTVPMFAIAAGLAFAVEKARREAFTFRQELTRRATTDEISGVSNRAHINQSAQNEFGRARRYKEPLSVMMIELDGYDSLMDAWGPIAMETLVQVFAGYCVLVMRHCDSFGRLSPNRFMALLPETPGKGAHILASRMCRELSKLDVVVDSEAINFTVSIGAAEMSTADRWAGDLLRRVERALDDAIESGRAQAILATPPRAMFADVQAASAGPGAEGAAPQRPPAPVTPLPAAQPVPPPAAMAGPGGGPMAGPMQAPAGTPMGTPGRIAGQGPMIVRG
ncbi:MAG: GGDEF domain-containing protein [Rhodospirillaceae bacterium]|nr:GGDEF domain-containing protein [Rhodospirillaceae bacterium]